MLLAILIQLFGLAAAPSGVHYLAPDDAHSVLIEKYMNAMASDNLALRNVDVEVTIDARLPKLNRQATLRAVRRMSSTGAVTYTTLDARGDGMIRREVIARYLAAESEARKIDEIAITPFNYRFHLRNVMDEPTRQIYVFQLTPKKKKVGLFKGELWVDGQTGLPVHESGQFIKSPSVFVKRISFTRDYVMRGGLGVPTYVHSIVESRVAGRVELSIHFADACAAHSTEVKPDAQ
jgi:hypothetical protein